MYHRRPRVHLIVNGILIWGEEQCIFAIYSEGAYHETLFMQKTVRKKFGQNTL